jgi:hypothetical protein
MPFQYPANVVFIDVDSEGQRDLFRNSGAAPSGISTLHVDHGGNQFSFRSFRTGSMPTFR